MAQDSLKQCFINECYWGYYTNCALTPYSPCLVFSLVEYSKKTNNYRIMVILINKK